ncbi:MAG: efflux RND transporter periplasmic adaptor subunit [Patescibacteria group bacterium]
MNISIQRPLGSLWRLYLRHKRIGILGIFIIVLAVFLVFVFRTSDTRSGYVFEKAQRTSLAEIVSESGLITTDGNLPIFSPTNGTVSEVYVENGEHVTKNQPLFLVVSSATDQEKKTAYANYMAAKSILDASNANLHTLQSSMFTSWKKYIDLSTNSTYENSDGTPNIQNRTAAEFISAQNDWLAAEDNFKNQQGVIARDQAAVDNAYNAYLMTKTATANSPIDGIVENISFSKGDSLHPQSALTPTVKPALIIKNSEESEGVVIVGQTNIAKIKIGQPVVIKPDAYKDKKFKGIVLRINSIGENVQGVTNYTVYVEIENDTSLKSGMTFDCDITTQNLENVLTIPSSAVVLNNGLKSVRVLEKNEMKYIPVIIGVKGETRTQILNGISEGQEIITALTNIRAKKPSFLGL